MPAIDFVFPDLIDPDVVVHFPDVLTGRKPLVLLSARVRSLLLMGSCCLVSAAQQLAFPDQDEE